MKDSKNQTRQPVARQDSPNVRASRGKSRPRSSIAEPVVSWPKLVEDESAGTAIQKATRLLQAIVDDDGLQLVDLANKVAMPKPSVHRLIQQLEQVGLVRKDFGGKGFTVGPTLLKLSVGALGMAVSRPPVRALMRELVDRIQESCNLAILDDYEVLYLERVECNFPLRMQLQAGSRVPLHCTAAGKLFLSQMPSAKRRRVLRAIKLERYTANTITDAGELEEECLRIRETKVSINREEFHVGLIGVAVPVLGGEGEPIASLAIHAPVFRMSVEAARSHVDLLRKTAEKISTEAGFRAD